VATTVIPSVRPSDEREMREAYLSQRFDTARTDFAQMMAEREEAFGHVPYCGGRPQYVLDETHTPVLVDGYTAMRWRSMYAERMVLGATAWSMGWHVRTQLSPWEGCFVTEIVAPGYDVSGLGRASSTAEGALAHHKEAVKLVMQVAEYHGKEAGPVEDQQLVLA